MTTYAALLLDKAKNAVSPANYSHLSDVIGVSKQAVSRWKKGVEPLPDERIAQLARIAGLDGGEWWVLVKSDEAPESVRRRVRYVIERLGIAAALCLAVGLPYSAKAEPLNPIYIMRNGGRDERWYRNAAAALLAAWREVSERVRGAVVRTRGAESHAAVGAMDGMANGWPPVGVAVA